MSLIRNVLETLIKSALIPLRFTAAASPTNASIYKNVGSGVTTLIVSNEEMNDIMKIIKSFEESGLLIKDVRETIKMKQNNKKEDFLECYQAI